MRKSARMIYLASLILLFGITIYPPVRSSVVQAFWTNSGYAVDPHMYKQWDTSTNRLLFLDFNYDDYIQMNGRWIKLTYKASLGYYRLLTYYIAIIILTMLMLILTSSKLSGGIIDTLRGK
jgi:hypothetical protein